MEGLSGSIVAFSKRSGNEIRALGFHQRNRAASMSEENDHCIDAALIERDRIAQMT